MKKILLIILLLLIIPGASAQEEQKEWIVLYARVIEGDTMPVISLKELQVYSFRPYKSSREARRSTKLIRNVKRVYPYAKIAGIKLKEYEEILASIEDKKERKRIMKQAEEELDEEFGDDLRDMTFSQGRILIKLIYRETGASSYDLVAELRGKFRAFFYQTFARIFGFNLKSGYDPQGKDKNIEFIVLMIEAGQL